MKHNHKNIVDAYGQLSRKLKVMCVAYIVEHFKDELDPNVVRTMTSGVGFPALGERFDSPDSAHAINRIDAFLLFGTTRSGMRILDVIREHAPLDREEQEVLVNWREKAFQSLFEITSVDRESVQLVDIAAEVLYTVYVNDISIASTMCARFNEKSFMITNLVPVHDLWFLSGVQGLYSRSDETKLMQMLTENFSVAAQYRNNPEKLKRARAIQKEEYERFVRHFKTDEVLASGEEISRLWETYYKARADELGHSTPVLPMPFENMEEEHDLGFVMDEYEGIHHFSGYGEFINAFARKRGARDSLVIVRDYLEDDSLPVFVFRRMKERFPENFRSVMRAVLGPAYMARDPIKDFDALMDDLKPGWRNTYPSIHPVNRRVQKYLYRRSCTSRNDPCPCGSGKKFKKCHDL